MDRRRFLLTSLAGGLAAPVAVEAQRAAKTPTVGYLSTLSRSDPTFAQLRDALRQGLRDHGYIEGQTITIEWRFAEGRTSRLADLAAELVGLKVDLLFAEATPAALAAKRATTTIPVVFSPVADPIGSGLVASLARPGGNMTGSTFMAPELGGKRLELLKAAAPKMTRVGVLSHPGDPSEATLKIILAETEAAARASGVQLQPVQAQGPGDLERAFDAMARGRVDGVILLPSAMFSSERRRLVDLAAKSRLPAMFFFKEFTEAGGLASYGPSFSELWRSTAMYVDQILKGAKPSGLPVQQPTKFEFIINLKTAKALGLTLPPSLLSRADQVIE